MLTVIKSILYKSNQFKVSRAQRMSYNFDEMNHLAQQDPGPYATHAPQSDQGCYVPQGNYSFP